MEESILSWLSQFVEMGYYVYVMAWCVACLLFASFAPAKITEKMPNFLMVVINASALFVTRLFKKQVDVKGNEK